MKVGIQLWGALLRVCEPLPHVQDISMRLQAQTNAAAALIILLIFMPLSLIMLILTSEVTPSALALRVLAVVSLIGVCVLARRGHIRATADALIGIGYGILWSIAIFADNTYIGTLRTLDLFVIIALVSVVVMPIRRALIGWLLSFLLLLVVPPLRPDVPPRLIYGGTVLFHLVAGGAALLIVSLLRRSEQLVRAAVLAKERELDTLISHLPDYVVRMDSEFRCLFANQAAQTLLERPLEALVGRSPSEVIPHLQSERTQNALRQWQEAFEETLRTGTSQRVEVAAGLHDGLRCWFDIICVPECDASGRVSSVLIVARDTTERRENEESLKVIQTLTQRLANVSPYMIYVRDLNPLVNERLVFTNRPLNEFVGCALGGKIALDDEDLIALTHPDDRHTLRHYLTERLQQTDVKSKTAEVRIRRADDEWRWVRVWASVFEDQQFNVRLLIGIMMDFTEEKQTRDLLIEREREQMNAEMTQKFNYLKTQLMIRIADQFRNPLAAIQSASELLERYYDRLSEPQRAARFNQIKAQIVQITELLDNMSMVLRQQDGKSESERQLVRLYALGADILSEMQQRYPLGHHVHFKCDPNAQTLISQDVLRLILTHLLSNAFLYTPEGGEVTLEIRAGELEMTLIVSDNGIGIEDEDGMRVFDPFYRGRNIDERPGLGLGLSIVRNQVLAHGGFIQLVSDVGVGTTVIIRLPNQSVPTMKLSGE